MNIRIEPITNQHGYLVVSFSVDDYLPKVNDELKRIKKSAQIKGFRQGAVPDGMVRKLYGDEIKADILNKLLNKSIEDYQKEQGLQFLGDLIPVPLEANQEIVDDLEFKFEIGISPKPEIAKIIEGFSLIRFNVKIPDDRIDEEVKHLQDKLGESAETEDSIIAEDFIELEAQELENGQVKLEGWKTQFPVSLGEHTLDDFANKLKGLKKGDVFDLNVEEIEKNLSEKEIRKYLLKIPDDQSEDFKPGNFYRATITKVMRKTPAELSEELYKKAFGPDTVITNETELRASLRTNLEAYFDNECSKFLDIELVKKFVHESGMNYPDQFLIKWLQATYPEWAEKQGHELEHELYHFKEGMSWRILRDKILEEGSLTLKYEDVAEIVIAEMKNQYPGIQLPDQSWQELAKRTLSDKEKSMHYFVEAQNQKALQWIKDNISLSNAEITLDEFRDKVKEINAHNH
ncbi:MAG: trigger factor [Saprospiraceae bacterium]